MRCPGPLFAAPQWRLAVPAVVLAVALAGCGPRPDRASVVQVKGSDTMVNVVQAWAEEYQRVAPEVGVEVSGGGSGVGIAALTRGAVDLATASREIKPEEAALIRANTDAEPLDLVVGHDALAVFVHRDNPMTEISFEQLAGVFAEDGTVTRWSQLGVTLPGARRDAIVRVSRQSSSGTYEFFREHVLANRDFKLGSLDMNGSKEVVELVGATLTAIGYSGIGYATPRVKMLPVALGDGRPPVAPTVASALSREYPLARSLHVYSLGEPVGEVARFVHWILSDHGQEILRDSGFVPVNPGLGDG